MEATNASVVGFAELLSAELKLDRSQWEERPSSVDTATLCLEADSLVSVTVSGNMASSDLAS